jgi:hypothetical protein
MKIKSDFKARVFQFINHELDKKIEVLNSSIMKLKESRDLESKSSMGDKYESSREVVQHEIENNGIMLQRIRRQKSTLNSIGIDAPYTTIKQGALVNTNLGLYFFSIGIGQIEIDDIKVFVVSANSPIGSLLNGSKVGDKIEFQGKKIQVKKIT